MKHLHDIPSAVPPRKSLSDLLREMERAPVMDWQRNWLYTDPLYVQPPRNARAAADEYERYREFIRQVELRETRTRYRLDTALNGDVTVTVTTTTGGQAWR